MAGPALVVPNTVQVRLLWNLGGQAGVNVLHGIAAGSVVVNQALAETVGAAVKSQFSSTFAAQIATNSALARVGLKDIRLANQTEFLDTGAEVFGTAAGDSLPTQTALCVTLRTAQSGKSFRGRLYLGGFSEASNDPNGLVFSGLATAAVAFVQGISSALTASQLTFCVTSRPAERKVNNTTTFHADGSSTVEKNWETTAKSGLSTAVTSIASRDLRWESQRRRNNSRTLVPTLLGPVAEVHLDR